MTGQNPRIDTYDVDLDDCGPMVLDALIKIKNEDRPDADLPPLLPRGHLRLLRDEHRRPNTLACTTAIDDVQAGRVKIYPLPHMPVVKDLVPDLTHFYAQYASIEPWLQTDDAGAARRNGASRRRTARSSTASTSASCAPAARPPARATGGTATAISARPRCCRPIAGSSTAATRRPASASTTSRTRSGSIAATRS